MSISILQQCNININTNINIQRSGEPCECKIRNQLWAENWSACLCPAWGHCWGEEWQWWHRMRMMMIAMMKIALSSLSHWAELSLSHCHIVQDNPKMVFTIYAALKYFFGIKIHQIYITISITPAVAIFMILLSRYTYDITINKTATFQAKWIWAHFHFCVKPTFNTPLPASFTTLDCFKSLILVCFFAWYLTVYLFVCFLFVYFVILCREDSWYAVMHLVRSWNVLQ